MPKLIVETISTTLMLVNIKVAEGKCMSVFASLEIKTNWEKFVGDGLCRFIGNYIISLFSLTTNRIILL
jgi:hypothetical protein